MKIKKLTYLVLISFIASIIVFIGCQQEESPASPNDNGAYLSLSPNVDFDNLTKGDWEVISRAFTRINLRENEDGLFEISYKSGAEINMSDELFGFFEQIAESSNEKILSGVYYTRNKIRTIREGGVTNTDCVARSIAYATGQDYNVINSQLIAKYGSNGVPSSEFYSAMNQFCNGVQVGLSMFSGMSDFASNGKEYVLVLNLQHAVTLLMKSGDSIMYRDSQTGSKGFCTVYDISHIYLIR